MKRRYNARARTPRTAAALYLVLVTISAPASLFAVGPKRGDASDYTPPPAPPVAPVAPVAPRAPVALNPPTPLPPLREEQRALLEQQRALEDLQRLGFDPMDLNDAAPGGWFGIGLRCDGCDIIRDESNGTRSWRFRSMPIIYSVDTGSPAARAGVQSGDVLAEVDGVSITSADGGKRFSAVKPRDTMRWKVFRDGKPLTLTLTAEKHPGRPRTAELEARAQLVESLEVLHDEAEALRKNSSSAKRDKELRALESAAREIQRSLSEIDRARVAVPPVPTAPVAPVAPVRPVAPVAPVAPRPGSQHHLRYRGAVGNSDIEVRGTGAVAVSEGTDDGEVVITTPDATIRIRKTK